MQKYNDDSSQLKDEIEAIEKKSRVFHAYTQRPENIDDSILHQLSDLINGFDHFTDQVSDINVGPSIYDKLKSSMAVAYIIEDSVAIAAACLFNPIEENYKGIIPQNYYELKSGEVLEGKLQQEYFVIRDGYDGKGLATTLRVELEKISEEMFVVINSLDIDTQAGLIKNGYTEIATFNTDWEDDAVILYINKKE